ncbi:hypothetical protein GCM10010124_28550 [Pilimelia terevasa]|uniref:Uncharacterized protein n=1 Tax=Pilimelia terevasa TaxID=53372 RepID=A0A8J3BN21_9ACTN|nr:hypothetical protein [Pilimelia terevasa]GGK34218.1 hypothetical protein GCM10010124_28550 [Pilimelia terevasa]
MQPPVADALRQGPFPHALRTAIKARKLSLERLHQRLAAAGTPVGMSTLSSWQSGRRRPERPESLEAVTVLEDILGLPARSLSDLLGAPRRRGPRPRMTRPPRPVADLLALASPAVALTRQLDWREDRLRIVSAWDDVEVGRGSCVVGVETRLVLEAVEEVDRYVATFHGAPGTGLSGAVRFAALADCHIGRVRQDPTHPLIAAELLLGRRLPPGETAIIRFGVTDGSGRRETEYGRFLSAAAQHVAVSVHFAPDARPRRCWRFVRDLQGWPDQLHKEVRLGPFGKVHVVRNSVPPGILGIAWQP